MVKTPLQSLELCKGLRKREPRMRRSRFSHCMRVEGIPNIENSSRSARTMLRFA